MAKIAILMAWKPSLDTADFVVEAVDSVFAQSFTDWELALVVDGAGVQLGNFPDPRVKILYHDTPQGPGAARNTGVRATTADWLLALDADDKLPPDALERLYAERCEFEILYGDVEWIGDRTGYQALYEWDPRRLLSGLLPVTALHSRKLWRVIGGWDERLTGLEDVEYWIRATEIGVCGRRINATTLQYRKRAGSRTTGLLENDKRLLGEVTREIHEKHRAFFGGNIMACAKCPGGGTMPQFDEPVPAGMVEMKYTGRMQGAFTKQSSITDQRYRIDGAGAHFFVDPRDVEWLLNIQPFGVPEYHRIDRTAAPAVKLFEALPSLPEADSIVNKNVKEAIKLIERTDEIPDLRVWLAEEEASNSTRSTVTQALTKRIAQLSEADGA